MKTRLFLFIILVACVCRQSLWAQDSVRILLVHSRHDVKDTSNEYLVGYHFKQGKFIKQDTILHRSRAEGSDDDGRISIGLFGDVLFYDRYLYTSIGLIIDLQEKKVLREDANMDFLEEKDRKLYLNNTFFNSKLDMYVFDLDRHTYQKVLSRPFEGFTFNSYLCSDDYNHFLEVGYESPGKLNVSVIDSTGRKRKLFVDDNKYPQLFTRSKAAGKQPLSWVDNDHFVYTHYIVHPKDIEAKPPVKDKDGNLIFEKIEADSTPCCSVELQEVNIKTGAKRFITTINNIYEPLVDDKLYATGHELIFRNRGADTVQAFRIDRFSGELKKMQPVSTPFRTEVGFLQGEKIMFIDSIFWKDQFIGSFHVGRRNYIDSMLVIWGSREPNGPNQLFVWSEKYPQWQSLPVGHFLGFLGWINKKEDE